MAIVVEVGGGGDPVAAGIAGALKGASDYVRGKKDAEKEREEKARREAEERRAQEAHDARMADLELDLEVGREERERKTQEWERKTGEGGTWDQEDIARERADTEYEQEQGRLKQDQKWREVVRRREMKSWQQSDDDRRREKLFEDQERDFWEEQRGWAQKSERERQEDRARRQRGLDRLERAAIEAEAAKPGEAQSFFRGVKASPISARYTDQDWKRIERQMRAGGIDAGRKEVAQINNIIRSEMDEEAATKLQTDPAGVAVGGLDQALNLELISPEEYQEAQESLAAWSNMSVEERAQARQSGSFRSPDSMLVGLNARKKAKRKIKARAREWGESYNAAEALYDATMTAYMEEEDFDIANLDDEQRESLAEAREIIGELQEAAESGVPGANNPAALVGKVRRALMAAKPLNTVQLEKAEARATELSEAKSEIRRLQQELKAAKTATPAADPATTPAPDYGTRVDGTPKGSGWKGEIEMTDGSGNVMTELSMTVGASDVGTTGDDVLIPTIVPTLTQAQVDHLASGGEPTEAIMRKAVAHAKARLKKGESVWKEDAAPASASNSPTASTSATVELTGDSIKDLPAGANAEKFRDQGEDAWLASINETLKSYGKPTHDNIDDAFSAYNDLREEAEDVAEASEKEKGKNRAKIKERVQSGPGGWRY